MTLRGVSVSGCSTVTSTLLGTLREDPRSRQEFFALTGHLPGRTVHSAGGHQLPYDALLLAVGTRERKPSPDVVALH
jgi:hypothetical protein